MSLDRSQSKLLGNAVGGPSVPSGGEGPRKEEGRRGGGGTRAPRTRAGPAMGTLQRAMALRPRATASLKMGARTCKSRCKTESCGFWLVPDSRSCSWGVLRGTGRPPLPPHLQLWLHWTHPPHPHHLHHQWVPPHLPLHHLPHPCPASVSPPRPPRRKQGSGPTHKLVAFWHRAQPMSRAYLTPYLPPRCAGGQGEELRARSWPRAPHAPAGRAQCASLPQLELPPNSGEEPFPKKALQASYVIPHPI